MIFKPTSTDDADIVIYSKWCVSCDSPEDLLAINMWALNNNLEVKVIRTAYRPADHRKAVELWSCRDDLKTRPEDYPAFVIYNGVHTLGEFIKMISNTKDKMFKGGKTKDDMQGLPKAKRTKRKNCVVDSISKSKEKDEK